MARHELWITRVQAGWLVGLSPRQFDEAIRPLIPDAGVKKKAKSLTFDASAVCAAHLRYRIERATPQPGDDESALLGAGAPADGEWLEEYRKVSTKLKQKDLEEREKTHANLSDLDDALARFAGRLHGAGEALQRQYGAAAAELLNQAIDDAVAQWESERRQRATTDADPATLATASTTTDAAVADAPADRRSADGRSDGADGEQGFRRGRAGDAADPGPRKDPRPAKPAKVRRGGNRPAKRSAQGRKAPRRA
jgi:hypothetical protein